MGRQNVSDDRRQRLRVEQLEARRLLAVTTVDTNLDVVDGGDGRTSLREAIALTNAAAGADTIDFSASLDGTVIDLDRLLGDIDITDSLTIDAGNLSSGLTIDAGNGADGEFGTSDGSRIFDIDDGEDTTFIDVEIVALTLTGGDAQKSDIVSMRGEDGGAIRSLENLTLNASAVTGNATGAGAIAHYGGNSGHGGGIFSDFGTLTLVDSLVTGNATADGAPAPGYTDQDGTSGHGGGIAHFGGALSIVRSTISGNRIGEGNDFSFWVANGGGIYAGGTSLTVIGSTISGNHIGVSLNAGSGGGIFIASGDSNIDRSTISENRAGEAYFYYHGGTEGGSGGGIHNRGGNLTITSSTIHGNVAGAGGRSARNGGPGGTGGGIAHDGGNFTITSSTISGNRAGDGGRGLNRDSRGGYGGDGGGIHLSAGELTIVRSTISGNRAGDGGYAELIGTRGGGAGGIHVDGQRMIVSQSTIVNNSAGTYPYYGNDGDFGGLYVRTTLPSTIAGSIVAQNSIEPNSLLGATDLGIHSSTALSITSSLIGDNSGTALDEAQTPDAAGNLIGSDEGDGAIDPLSAPLDDYGGSTQTHALLAGSPAIDAGATIVLVTPAGVASSTAATDLFPVENLINNSGLDPVPHGGNYQNLAHAIADDQTAWVTDQPGPLGSYYYQHAIAPALTFDLGSERQLDGMALWGYLLPAGENNNEARALTLEFSTDGGFNFGNPLVLEHARTGEMQETLMFGHTIAADAVRVTITNNHFGSPGAAGGGRVGLGEVKFITMPEASPFDQRGEPFVRIAGQRIDMGAFERQDFSADFNGDGDTDARDFLFWQRGFGTPAPNALPSDGDADGDHDVDDQDLQLWEATYGIPTPPPTTASAAQILSELKPAVVDAAIAADVPPTGAGQPRARRFWQLAAKPTVETANVVAHDSRHFSVRVSSIPDQPSAIRLRAHDEPVDDHGDLERPVGREFGANLADLLV